MSTEDNTRIEHLAALERHLTDAANELALMGDGAPAMHATLESCIRSVDYDITAECYRDSD